MSIRDNQQDRTSKNASCTLYWVTRETRASRSSRIRDVFEKEPAWGYLMAAFDFEWTVRRAIVLMSTCPTAVLGMAMEARKPSGLLAYNNCWNRYVKKLRQDEIPDIIDIAFDDFTNRQTQKSRVDQLNEAMQLRHRLVHGISGSIPAEKASNCFNMLLSASENISAYVDTHAEKKMNDRVIRRQERCNGCQRRKACPLRKGIAPKEFQCNRKQKCPFVTHSYSG